MRRGISESHPPLLTRWSAAAHCERTTSAARRFFSARTWTSSWRRGRPISNGPRRQPREPTNRWGFEPDGPGDVAPQSPFPLARTHRRLIVKLSQLADTTRRVSTDPIQPGSFLWRSIWLGKPPPAPCMLSQILVSHYFHWHRVSKLTSHVTDSTLAGAPGSPRGRPRIRPNTYRGTHPRVSPHGEAFPRGVAFRDSKKCRTFGKFHSESGEYPK